VEVRGICYKFLFFSKGNILFHLVPLRVLKYHLNGATQTSCDHAHQDSAKRKRKKENQLYNRQKLKIVDHSDSFIFAIFFLLELLAYC